ncbi:hypothetical protein PENTCL1PPCAC_3668, partial [Pristionchus entomophagus]
VMNLNYCRDALILVRYYYGPNHEITRRVHDAWTEAVLMKDDENKFRMIKIARSINTSNLKDIAINLMREVGSKTKGNELIDAYRCLSLALEAVNSSQLSEFERKLEVAGVSRIMYSIFVTMLAWGKIHWAKGTLADLAKRAPLGDVPSNICLVSL